MRKQIRSSITNQPVNVQGEPVYDPLDYNNLGESIHRKLMERIPIPLKNLSLFSGAGIYAIYYSGVHKLFPAYELFARLHADERTRFSRPIYVGKADPAGARTGGRDLQNIGMKLAHRLREHSRSISAAITTLSIDDFWCRYLLVQPVWIPLGESIVINLTNPLWNVVVDGFGNHQPGGGREKGMRPRWDTIHPGRSWAAKLSEHKETQELILTRIERFLEGDMSVRLSSDELNTGRDSIMAGDA